jgi:hypothetical protein
MTHFATLVLVRTETADAVAPIAEELLAPYCEQITVEEYETPCGCIGRRAENDARKEADRVETIDALRERFNQEHGYLSRERSTLFRVENPTAEQKERMRSLQSKIETLWESESFFGAYEKRRTDALQAHPDLLKASADCDACRGTGIVTSTYNPRSKWDWHSVGGRYNGLLVPYVKDARRASGFSNIERVSNLRYDDEKFGCVAVVTSDGEWHEQGRVGWWGSLQKTDDSWPQTMRSLFAAHKDAWVVVMDLHI